MEVLGISGVFVETSSDEVGELRYSVQCGSFKDSNEPGVKISDGEKAIEIPEDVFLMIAKSVHFLADFNEYTNRKEWP
jgi:hypothetical protein